MPSDEKTEALDALRKMCREAYANCNDDAIAEALITKMGALPLKLKRSATKYNEQSRRILTQLILESITTCDPQKFAECTRIAKSRGATETELADVLREAILKHPNLTQILTKLETRIDALKPPKQRQN